MAFSDVTRYSLSELVSNTSTVYSLPLFYQRLNEAINHPRTSVNDIANIITEDQGLTVRLLKLANSPMFGYFGNVDSINRAVTIIGTQQLRDLALAVSVMGVFKGIPDELLSMPQFWRHSIACGIVSRSLAIWRREANVERFFLAGMLHDIGQLVMATAMPVMVRQMIEQARRETRSYFDVEKEQLGYNHAEAGSELLKEWKIPSNIAEPVGYHHHPGKSEKFPMESAMIHCSDVICQGLLLGRSCSRFVPPLDLDAWEYLDMSPAELASLIQQIEPQLEETFEILNTTS